MKFRRLRAVAHKELLHILRDPRSLVMSLALPVVMMALFGYALTLDVDRIPLALFDQDQTPDSRDLVSRFSGSRYFELVADVDGYAEAQTLIDRGECLAVLAIQRDYGSDLRRGKTPTALIPRSRRFARPSIRPKWRFCWLRRTS